MSVKATYEGVVRLPWSLGMISTLHREGLLPSDCGNQITHGERRQGDCVVGISTLHREATPIAISRHHCREKHCACHPLQMFVDTVEKGMLDKLLH